MTVPVWVALIPSAVAILIAAYTYFHNKQVLAETKRHNRATVEEARIAKQEAFIESALSEFYYPTLGYLQVSRSLYRLLTAGKPEDFRLVSHLLNPQQTYEIDGIRQPLFLSDSDKSLITEIIQIEAKLEDVFLTKSGFVEDSSLIHEYEPNPDITDVELDVKSIGLISLAIAHFRVLRLAHEGQLKGDTKTYQQFVFPRELPVKISENIEKLRKQLNSISNSFLEQGENL